MIKSTRILTLLMLFLVVSGLMPPAAHGEPHPSSELLLPYFEVDLTEFGLATLFQVSNASDLTVPVVVEVFSNWGIPLLKVKLTLEAEETRTFNLRDWLMLGELPEGSLSPGTLAHIQAALSGEVSPRDQLYYASQMRPQTAVGYVKIRSDLFAGQGVLWGNYFVIDPEGNSAQGDVLANIDRHSRCNDLCLRHRLLFLDGGAFDGGTELVIWNDRRGQPSLSAGPQVSRSSVELVARNLQGVQVGEGREDVLSTHAMPVSELLLPERFGTLDLVTTAGEGEAPVESFIGIRYTAGGRFSVGMQAFCQPIVIGREESGPALTLEKLTNDEDADTPTGPHVPVGDPVHWKYVVTNTGSTVVSGLEVVDDQGVGVVCPKSSLAPGETMTCTGEGIAEAGQYRNVGTVLGLGPDGEAVSDSDPSHYFGDTLGASLRLEKATNGEDADTPTGPRIPVGAPVTWTFHVTNTGQATLVDVSVTDDKLGAIACPKTALAPGESMTCTAHGTAEEGQYRNEGWARGVAADGQVAEDHDPSHYFGDPGPKPEIDLEKLTNGEDADTPTGPRLQVGDAVTWTYRVVNTGTLPLVDVSVTDDKLGAIACPKSSLAPGESMTCTAHGTAEAGQYRNEGWAQGIDADGQVAEDHDPSHYFGEEIPEITGRMTGGGSVFDGSERFTHGFELHCDTSDPNNLEINWGVGNQFHLTELTSAVCSDDPSIEERPPSAGFDTFEGTGTGRLNGIDGATITFRFTDAGEPGKIVDLAEFRIVPPGGGAAIVVSGFLEKGNHQAHGN